MRLLRKWLPSSPGLWDGAAPAGPATAGAAAREEPRPPTPFRSRLAWVGRLLVAAGLILLILRKLDLGEFQQVIVSAQWGPLAVMVVAALVFMLLGIVKVWIILLPLAPVHLVTVLRYGIVATALGTFTPAALGDFSLVGFLRREGIPVHKGFSAMLVDRGITLVLNGLVYLPLTVLLVLDARQWLWVPLAVGLAVAIALSLNLITPFRRWLRERIVKPFLPRLEDFLRACSDLLRVYPAYLLANIGVTLARSLVAGWVIAMALLAASTSAGLLQVTVLTNSLSLLNYVPISLSGVGVYEGGAVALFSRLGLSGERVFAAFVFQRAYMILSSLLFLGLARPLMGGKLSADRAGEAEVGT